MVIVAFIANTYRAIDDEAKARDAIARLATDDRIKGSLAATQHAAAELVDFGLLDQAYQVIRSIEKPADRAVPLAKLAESMAKSSDRQVGALNPK